MKKFVSLLLVFNFTTNAMAEVVCTNSVAGTNMQECQVVEESDPNTCSDGNNQILEHTKVDQYPILCDNQTLMDEGHDKKELEDIKNEYNKLCKKKAKAYKKALMGNLLSKGKIGQLVQVLFSKKKRKAEFKNGKNTEYSIDASKFEGKSEQEIEDMILTELENQSGISGLKEKSKLAQEKPEFKLGYHQAETIPVNVMVKTKKNNSCKVEVDKVPPYKEVLPESCEFCVEKNISSSFTNDCAYMVNSVLSEKSAQELLNVKERSDYCNAPSMEGVENDLKDIEKMVDNLCNIAQKGLKPDFTIETSRNLYRDKTVNLAAKRGEFIQKYIRDQLLNGKRCDLEGEDISWLKEDEFKKAVKVKHPYYKDGKEGDYGPSPYAEGENDQGKEVENLRLTLEHEKEELKQKNDLTKKDKLDSEERIKKFFDQAKTISQEYDNLSTELKSIKKIDEEVFYKKRLLEEKAQAVQQIYNKINEEKQKISELNLQVQGFTKRLSTIDDDNLKKITLLKEYYTEKNTKGDAAIDRKAWDEKLFNGFKMVRITGKAVEDNVLGVDPKYVTPAVKIALNAMVDVDNFTCVVEPIKTRKTTLSGILKGGLKVVTVLASPVVAVAGAGAAVVAMPFTFTGSFFCQGCGEPGNIPPALRFGNPRSLDLSKSSRKRAWGDIKDAWDAYTSWGGLLDVNTKKNTFENSTEDVWEEQQKRKGNNL